LHLAVSGVTDWGKGTGTGWMDPDLPAYAVVSYKISTNSRRLTYN